MRRNTLRNYVLRTSYRSSIAYAWGIYAGVILVELLVDYLIRSTSDNFYTSGIPEPAWFIVQTAAAAVAGLFIIYGARYLQNVQRKVAHVVVNLVAGILFYGLVVYSYVLGLGIDSL